MQEILKTTLLGLFFGTFGTTIGGILGIVIKKNSNKFLSFILSFATGIIVSTGLAIHIFPEGLAIGSGFEASLKLGLSLGTSNLLL